MKRESVKKSYKRLIELVEAVNRASSPEPSAAVRSAQAERAELMKQGSKYWKGDKKTVTRVARLYRIIEAAGEGDGFFIDGTLYSGEYGHSIRKAAREALRLLAGQDREPWKQSRKDRAQRTVSLNIDATLKLYIDADGLIQTGKDFFIDSFLPALKGKEVYRLRICPECDRLFVAKRIDQPSCTECNGLYWAHKLRGKPKRIKEKQS